MEEGQVSKEGCHGPYITGLARGLWRMSNVDEMVEFMTLWGLFENFQLNDQDDSIVWRWTTNNGSYTTRSAYLAQLNGTFNTFDALSTWCAHSEGKSKFFAWLLMQNKILTADKLAARNCPCKPSMCIMQPGARDGFSLVFAV
jgi:hypothetical protein